MNRPQNLSEVIGNEKIKRCLRIAIDAARKESREIPHCIFQGQSGSGKTTLAYAAAKEYGSFFRTINAAGINSAEQIIKILVSSQDKDIIFIDEIHALKPQFQEILYPALEDRKLTIKNKDRSITVDVKKFTLFAATTHIGQVNGPLLNRFKYHLFIEPYSLEEMTEIVTFYSKQRKCKISPQFARLVAERSKFVPRVAQSRIDWILDYFTSTNNKPSIVEINKAFDLIGIDEEGLDYNDRKYLEILESSDEPLGLKAISSMSGIPEDSIENHIEPYLLSQNMIVKTKKGRDLAGRTPEDYYQQAIDSLGDL